MKDESPFLNWLALIVMLLVVILLLVYAVRYRL
jgi:uncharacterized integral membrane protein